jgi:hypothetical protein
MRCDKLVFALVLGGAICGEKYYDQYKMRMAWGKLQLSQTGLQRRLKRSKFVFNLFSSPNPCLPQLIR